MRFFLLFLVPLISKGLLAQIPNPSFENWDSIQTGANGWISPIGWTTNYTGSNFATNPVTKNSDAYAGVAAAKLSVESLKNSTTNACGQLHSMLFKVNAKVTALHVWYKGSLYLGDVAFIDINSPGGEIAVDSIFSSSPTAYTEVIVNFPKTVLPSDSLAIHFVVLNKKHNLIGLSGATELLIDDLYFDSLATSVPERTAITSFQQYPNPTSEKIQLNYSLNKESDVKIQLSDITGKATRQYLNETQAAGNYKLIENVADLRSGLYFLEMNAGSNVMCKKIMIE